MKNIMLVGLVAATLAAFSLAPPVHAQDAAATTCKDGTTTATTGRGACSGHGGVQKKTSSPSDTGNSTAPNPTGSSTASAPASGNAESTPCKDGTTSASSGRGACSGHGGVQKKGSGSSAAGMPASASSTAPNNAGSSTASAPASGSVDQTTCKDGSTSQSSGRGACSGHGGVQKGKVSSAGTSVPSAGSSAPAAEQAPVPAAGSPSIAAKSSTATKSVPADEAGNTDPTGATAKCKDGTYSKSKHHTGTCSHHGGVAQWLDGSSN